MGSGWNNVTYEQLFDKYPEIRNDFMDLLIPEYSKRSNLHKPKFLSMLVAKFSLIYTIYSSSINNTESFVKRGGKTLEEYCF